MYGLNGKIARIDLSSKNVLVENPSEQFYRHYLGGRGIIIHTLLKEVPKGIDPFGSQNKLIFALGPVTGHPFVGSGRNSVGCKSPLSGGYGESEAGGFWGAELKRAGYDAIIVEGVSDRPVYIRIDDKTIEICDATSLWGKEVADTQNKIKEELGDKNIKTAAIGPAGENLVRFACILNDITHAAGRTGMGAVMGSKKLKAIAVRGSRPPLVAEKNKLAEINRSMLKNFKERSKHWMVGTGRGIVNHEKTGNLPIKNFRGGPFPGVEKITAQLLCENYLEKMDGCFGCPIRCKRVVKLDKPFAVDPVYGGPEYETLAALGSNCGIDDLKAIMKANELCNRYGLDTISTGVVISFAMECFENRILTLQDTDGVDLTFGNSSAMLQMVEKIAHRDGFGNLLAQGTRRASEKIGRDSHEFAMQVKGEEIPMHDPRLKQALAVHYSTHSTGADHTSGASDQSPLNKDTATMMYEKGFKSQLVNYLGLCKFVPWSHQETEDAVKFITGWQISPGELMAVVERGITLTRIFNIREGFSATDDILPKRFSSTPAESPLKGIDPVRLLEVQKEYYHIMGWNDAGVPTPEKLKQLDIEWAATFLN